MLVADGLYFQAITPPGAGPGDGGGPDDAAVTWFIERVLRVRR